MNDLLSSRRGGRLHSRCRAPGGVPVRQACQDLAVRDVLGGIAGQFGMRVIEGPAELP